MKPGEELLCKFKDRNLKEELEWSANYTRYGYMNKANADYYSWLAYAALLRIKELEARHEG